MIASSLLERHCAAAGGAPGTTSRALSLQGNSWAIEAAFSWA
jgi:hypothetical protein